MGKIGGNVDYWGVLLETGGKPSKAKRPIKYKKVKGPGAGAIKDGQAGTKDNYKKYGNGEKECVLKAIEICQCPANYRSNDSHKMINYSMFEFDNCKDVTWGNAMCSNGEEAECTMKSVTGKMKSFTGYKHMYGNYAFPTGFVFEDWWKRGLLGPRNGKHSQEYQDQGKDEEKGSCKRRPHRKRRGLPRRIDRDRKWTHVSSLDQPI